MQLTQKETELLKDLKTQEKLCADKYNQYAQSAIDPQLKNLFSQIAGVEEGHLRVLPIVRLQAELKRTSSPINRLFLIPTTKSHSITQKATTSQGIM